MFPEGGQLFQVPASGATDDMVSGAYGPCCPRRLPSPQVLSQLEACGLVETIHISAAGFPIR